MRRTALLGLLASLAFAPAAHAFPAPAGALCGVATANSAPAPGTQNGFVLSGPVAMRDSNPRIVHTGYVACAVQVNAAAHSAADVCATATLIGPVSAVLPPVPCSYPATANDTVYVCTSVHITGQPALYYDDTAGVWSTSSAAPCAPATRLRCDNSEPACATANGVLTPVKDTLDQLLCPPLALVFPPQGDVPPVWDCPPYASPGSTVLNAVAFVLAPRVHAA